MLSTPDGAALDRALPDLDFMAAVDIYVNETTRHADVILPPTTALERDHYDVVFHTLAVRNTARFTPAVLTKDPGSRHDWEIFREIALRTARRLPTKAPLRKRLALWGRLRTSPTRQIAPAAAPRPVRGDAAHSSGADPRVSISVRCSPAGCRPHCTPRTIGSGWRPTWSWTTSPASRRPNRRPRTACC